MILPQTPSFRLDGQRALVTGAGRGIGLAAAAALASAGADVTLLARTHNEISAASDAIREAGGIALRWCATCLTHSAFRLAELYPPHLKSTASSIFNWGRLVSFFAPLITGALAGHYGLRLTMLVSSLTFVAAAIIWHQLPETLPQAGASAIA